MKTLKQILVVMMMILMSLSSLDTLAQSRKSRSNHGTKTTTAKTMTPTTNDIISGFEMMANKMSAMCPMDMEDGLVKLQSVSFNNKCLSMTYAYTDKFEKLLDGTIQSDYSYCEYNMKLTIASLIKSLNVSARSFGQTGISFRFTFKDNYGKVLWSGKITPNEYVAFCNELSRKGEMPSSGKLFNLESFRQMVQSWDAETPQDLGDGLTLFDVSMDGTDIYFNTSTPYSYAIVFELLDDAGMEEVKRDVAKSLYDLYIKLSPSGKNSILDNMIRLGITVNYRYYVENDDVPFKTISMPASYIKRIGTQGR